MTDKLKPHDEKIEARANELLSRCLAGIVFNTTKSGGSYQAAIQRPARANLMPLMDLLRQVDLLVDSDITHRRELSWLRAEVLRLQKVERIEIPVGADGDTVELPTVSMPSDGPTDQFLAHLADAAREAQSALIRFSNAYTVASMGMERRNQVDPEFPE